MSDVLHGGRLDETIAQFGGKADKWIDLSTGINPYSYPVPEIPSSVFSRLPDALARQNAEQAARALYGVHPQTGLSMAAGSQAHIQNLPYLFKPQAVAIVGFTYQEHGVCWRRAGHDVYVTDGLESAEATARIVIVVNPNNPDGRVFDRQELAGLARRLGAKGGLLVVDESFGDVAPNASVANQAGRDGLLVLRSLGKFFGLAGLRFGVALGVESVTRRLDEMLGPWAVSGPALYVAAQALDDVAWQKKMRKKLNGAREKLEDVLIENNHEVVGGTALFVLARHGGAEQLWEHLAKEQILVRRFPGKSEWLRFGLPAKNSAFNRLNKALGSFYSGD
ncbi:MAG: threonine-phosphate decarboxylase CobD [Rhizobiaceae bacterium]